MRGAALPLLFIALFLGVTAASSVTAATIVSQDRGTFARSWAVQSPEFQEDVQAGETRTFEPFTRFDTSHALLPPSIGTSSAWLASRIGTLRTSVRGSALSILVAPGGDRLVEAPADSFFELVFDVEEGETFVLQGHVDALAFDAEGFASVELVDLDSTVIIAQHVAGAGEYDPFEDTGTLTAGRYRLTAFALSQARVQGEGGDAYPAALASFHAVFAVPEPSLDSGGIVALLVIAVAATARRTSR